MGSAYNEGIWGNQMEGGVTEGWHDTDYAHLKRDKVYARPYKKYCPDCKKLMNQYNVNECCFVCERKRFWEGVKNEGLYYEEKSTHKK